MTIGQANPDLESVQNSSTTLVKILQTLQLTVLHRLVRASHTCTAEFVIDQWRINGCVITTIIDGPMYDCVTILSCTVCSNSGCSELLVNS